jgi:hypothetical protein
MAVLEELERRLEGQIRALPPAVKGEILRVFALDGPERAKWISELYAVPGTRALAEVLIDMESERPARALVLGMLLEDALRDEDLGTTLE